MSLDQPAAWPQAADAFLLAASPPGPAAHASQRCLPLRHRLQQLALLLQRGALQPRGLLAPLRPVPLHSLPLQPRCSSLRSVAEGAVGADRCRRLGLGLRAG